MKKFTLLLVLLVAAFALPTVAQEEELLSVSAESCDYGGIIKSIEAVDSLTVKFSLCVPDPAFPSKAAFSAFGIQSSENLEASGGAPIETPVGTGPYSLERWDRGTEIVFTRNESYWGEPAKEGTLIFRWNSESAARVTELQAGTVDGIDNPGPADFALIEGDPNLALFPRDGANVFYIGFNNTIAPFDNPLVRQAIAHAIDKQRIVDNFYPEGSSVATQFMPPAIPSGYTPEVEPFPYDPERARELLAEAGVTLPLEVKLTWRDVVRGYLPTPGIVANDIASQLAEVGINVTVEVVESGAFIQSVQAGTEGFYLLGWGADYPDATNFLDYHFGDNTNAQFGTKFDTITAPLKAAASLSDFEARQALYVEANTAIRDNVPMIPVAHGGSATAFRAEIVGAHSSPLSNEQFSVVEDPSDDVFVWMQNGEPISLYCADETDGESLRACEQVVESLLGFEVGSTGIVNVLAESYSANEDLTEWTFTLREGVTFHDGTALDANDVVLSWLVQWDASHPLHVGNSGQFEYFGSLFGAFLNAPATE
ncbi:MAG: ABC transporter substrate-binding protein [Anaerolineae bacterium]|jgi:ABC-type transport system substrate-binding protein|nr:ABC transporter substrate-binding protein [Anaerolineae bacterium]